MHRKALLAVLGILAVTSATALAANTTRGDEGVPAAALNSGKHCIKKDGSIKPGCVAHRSIRNQSISCQKLVPSLQEKLCGGVIGTPGPKGDKGPAGPTGGKGDPGTPGTNGVNGATGPQGARGDGTIVVNLDTPGVCYTNPSVHLTKGGVVFGPYESNEEGGSVCVDLGTGHHLRDLAHLTYTASFNATTDNGDAPYLRVFTTDGTVEHDVIFSPSTQPGACYGPIPIVGAGSQCNSKGRMILYTVENGTVRYDDDPGTLPDVSWASVLNTHGSDEIEAIYVTSGFALPDTTGAVLNSLSYEVAGLQPTTLTFSS